VTSLRLRLSSAALATLSIVVITFPLGLASPFAAPGADDRIVRDVSAEGGIPGFTAAWYGQSAYMNLRPRQQAAATPQAGASRASTPAGDGTVPEGDTWIEDFTVQWRVTLVAQPQPPPAAERAAPAARSGPVGEGTTVLASWYGPGLYGNRTACGQLYTTSIQGVAHRTLPCGTQVTLAYAGNVVTVPVIDRGPFIAGREFDLSNATRIALGCPDLCRLQWIR
jgi:hypothetical protein